MGTAPFGIRVYYTVCLQLTEDESEGLSELFCDKSRKQQKHERRTKIHKPLV